MRTGMRRGVALLAALALLSLVALLIAGSFASLTLSQRSVRGAGADELLIASADYALNTVLASPGTYGLVDLTYGQAATFDVGVPGTQPVAVRVAVTRLAAGTLWLVADAAFVRGDSARRRVNLVARFASAGRLPLGPIQSRGNVRLARGVSLGADSASDVECTTGAARVMVGPGAAVASADSVASAVDTAAADSASYYLTAAQLAMLDSAGALHVRGDTTISAGAFDGVMLVDGTITVTGAWTVHGLVVARGRVQSSSGTLSLTGALLSYAPLADSAAVDLAAGTISWSPCTVQGALRRVLGARPVRQRSWAELF